LDPIYKLEREARVKASHQIEGSLMGPISGAISDLLVAEKNLDQTFSDIATFFIDSDLCANALLAEIDRHKVSKLQVQQLGISPGSYIHWLLSDTFHNLDPIYQAKFHKYSMSGRGMHAITILFTKTYTKLQRVAGMGKRFKFQHDAIKKVIQNKVRMLQKAAEKPQVLKLRPKFKNPFFMQSLQELNKEFELVKQGTKLAHDASVVFPGTGMGWAPPIGHKKKSLSTASQGDGDGDGDDDDGDDDDVKGSSNTAAASGNTAAVNAKKAIPQNPFGQNRRRMIASSLEAIELQTVAARKGLILLSGALLGAVIGWASLRASDTHATSI
jgi:hypothetical protein